MARLASHRAVLTQDIGDAVELLRVLMGCSAIPPAVPSTSPPSRDGWSTPARLCGAGAPPQLPRLCEQGRSALGQEGLLLSPLICSSAFFLDCFYWS